MSPTEQRRFIRKNALHLLDYLIFDQNGLQTTYSMGRTLDVSENGLKLETTEQIAIGDTLLITVGLEDDLIDLRGEVVYTEVEAQRTLPGLNFRVFPRREEGFLKNTQRPFTR